MKKTQEDWDYVAASIFNIWHRPLLTWDMAGVIPRSWLNMLGLIPDVMLSFSVIGSSCHTSSSETCSENSLRRDKCDWEVFSPSPSSDAVPLKLMLLLPTLVQRFFVELLPLVIVLWWQAATSMSHLSSYFCPNAHNETPRVKRFWLFFYLFF